MDTNSTVSKSLDKIDSAEQEIRQRTEEYRVLHEVARVLHNTQGLKQMLESALKVLTQFKELKVEYKAGIFLADEEKRVLRLFSTIGKFTNEFLEKEKEIDMKAIYQFDLKSLELLDVGSSDSTDDDAEE